MPIGGMKAEEPQNAQIIFSNALARIADETNAPPVEIGKAPDMIVHNTVTPDIERVHGKIAPFRIVRPVAAERHFGMAPEGLDILPQGRDFEWLAVDHDRDRSV